MDTNTSHTFLGPPLCRESTEQSSVYSGGFCANGSEDDAAGRASDDDVEEEEENNSISESSSSGEDEDALEHLLERHHSKSMENITALALHGVVGLEDSALSPKDDESDSSSDPDKVDKDALCRRGSDLCNPTPLRAKLQDPRIRHSLQHAGSVVGHLHLHHYHWPRLLDRKGACRQSNGHLNIRSINRDAQLFLHDLYHLFVEMGTLRLLALLWMVYSIVLVIFAFVFWWASDECALFCESFVDALYLSIETMTTVGYGVPDPYFRECPFMMVFLLCQCFFSIVFDAALIGILYQRISRGNTRASTILFSDKATLRTIGGHTYLLFQVCEMRRTQLLECHIRCYSFSRQRP